MKKITLKRILVVGALLSLSACATKEEIRLEDKTSRFLPDFEKRQFLMLSDEQQQDVEKLNQIALILTELSTDEHIAGEVHQGVHLMSSGDEDILFRDLLDSRSKLYPRSQSAFASTFLFLLEKGNYGGRRWSSQDIVSLKQFMQQKNLQLYWPYHEDWDGQETPTVSFHPISNDDENIGYHKKADVEGQYDTVTVNEEYALKHPVWIVTFGDPPAQPTPAPGYLQANKRSEEATLVYLGWAQCKHNYDGLFDKGSEIVFGRVEGRAKIDDEGKISTSVLVDGSLQIEFTRKEIRKQTWKRVYVVWDGDWNENKITQHFFIFERDFNADEKKFSSSVTTALAPTTPVNSNLQTNIAFTASYQSKEDIIYALNWARAGFLKINQNDFAGFGKRDGFPVQSGGTEIFFTLPNY